MATSGSPPQIGKRKTMVFGVSVQVVCKGFDQVLLASIRDALSLSVLLSKH
jgi:hypothetical protein